VKNSDCYFIFNEKGALVISELTPNDYEKINRCKLLPPTNTVYGCDLEKYHSGSC
jgi:hypothetical protein